MINMFNVDSDKRKLRNGVTQFVSEFTDQTFEDASEYNCEMIDWIISCIEKSFAEK